MELTAARLRTLAETARMIVGADDVEIGPGDERRVPVTLYFNRDEEVVAHGPADGVHCPVGRRPVVVVKEVTTNELAADGLGGRGGEAPGGTEPARPFTLTEGKTKSLTRCLGDPIPPRPASPPPSQCSRAQTPRRFIADEAPPYEPGPMVRLGRGARSLPYGSFVMSSGLFSIVVTEGDDPVDFNVVCQVPAFIPPDFEIAPWSELGRQWPHPESYLDKLRLFRSRENPGDRQVIVTVCLADQPEPTKETP